MPAIIPAAADRRVRTPGRLAVGADARGVQTESVEQYRHAV